MSSLIDEARLGDARARRSSAGTRSCGASIARHAQRICTHRHRASPSLYLLVFQTNAAVVGCRAAARRSRRRRSRPMRSSCLPAASANRARPAAASRNGSSRRRSVSAPATRRLIFSSGFVFASRKPKSMRALAIGQRHSRRRSSSRSSCARNTYENVAFVAARSSIAERLERDPAGQLAVPHAPRAAGLAARPRRISTSSPTPLAEQPVLRAHARRHRSMQIRGIAAGVRRDRPATGGAAGSVGA